jgi:hypothetical protein
MSFGQTPVTFYWSSSAGSNDWSGSSHWWNGSSNTSLGSNGNILFDNSHETAMDMDITNYSGYRVSFLNGSASRTINGTGIITFYDFNGNIPAIYNGSGNTINFNSPIEIGNNSTSTSPSYGFEINAENGILNIGSTIVADNSTGTKVLVLMESSSGGNGSNITISGEVN